MRFQWDEVATEGDVYRFVARLFSAFDEAICAEAPKRCACNLNDIASGGVDSLSPREMDALSEAMSEAIAAVLGTTGSFELEPLQEAADR